MAKLRERDPVVMEMLRERGWSRRATVRELGVDESTLRYRIRRCEGKVEDGRRRQAEACAPWEGVIGPWLEAEHDCEGARPDSRPPDLPLLSC